MYRARVHTIKERQGQKERRERERGRARLRSVCNDMRKLNWKSTKWFINKAHQAYKKVKGSNGQGKGEGAGKGGEEDGEAGAGGAEIKAKRCRETRATYKAKGLWGERDGEGKTKREGRWKEGGRESVPQGRANAAFTFHLSRGHNLLQQGSELALNSIKATEAATSVDPRPQSTAQLASLPGSHVGSGF